MPSFLMKFFAVTLSILLADWPATASTHKWKVYANARFDYSICYPADLLTAHPEADNGDGGVFSDKSRVELRVWGWYNVLKQDMDAIVAGLASANAVISYRHTGTNWAVISGRENGTVFYAKTLKGRLAWDDIDSILVFRLTYPQREAGTYDPVAISLSKCFQRTGKNTTGEHDEPTAAGLFSVGCRMPYWPSGHGHRQTI